MPYNKLPHLITSRALTRNKIKILFFFSSWTNCVWRRVYSSPVTVGNCCCCCTNEGGVDDTSKEIRKHTWKDDLLQTIIDVRTVRCHFLKYKKLKTKKKKGERRTVTGVGPALDIMIIILSAAVRLPVCLSAENGTRLMALMAGFSVTWTPT